MPTEKKKNIAVDNIFSLESSAEKQNFVDKMDVYLKKVTPVNHLVFDQRTPQSQ
jgi:hypothetical protein